MKNIKFIAMMLAVIMMLSISSVLPVLADEPDAEAPETVTEETTEETTKEETTTPSTSSSTVLTEDYEIKSYETNEDKLATMELVYSDYGYDLYYHKETGEVQIIDTATGQYLSTNPFDVADSKNKDTEKKALLSQIIVNYNDAGEEKSMTSYESAALLSQINMSKIRGGIRVEYTIGRGSTKRTLPMMIEKQRFEEYILKPLSESGEDDMYKRFKSYYLLKDPNQAGLTQSEIQTLYNTLPITRQMAVYVIDPTVANVERELKMFENFILSYTTYTYDDVLYDHDLTGYTGSTKNPAVFRMALEYYITEDKLEVRLPARGIRYDAKQYSLTSIKILPYMGAYLQTEKGYVVLPDGSGTLVRFEDTAENVSTTITNRLYGEDYSFYSQKSIANMENWTLPIYGMVERKANVETGLVFNEDGTVSTVENVTYDSQGFLAIITEGDSLSEITTASGGILNKYFATSINVYPRPKDTYPLDGISVSGNIAEWTVDTDKKYTGNYRIKYIMMKGDDANYVNMANLYRNYLEQSGKLVREDREENVELYIETFGSIEATERILGVPVDKKKPLTTFDDAKTIIDDLAKDGITNLSLKYTGWANGGLAATAPTRAKVESILGGKKGLTDLVSYASSKGVKIFPDYDFVYISHFSNFDKFDIKEDTVKTVDDRSAVHRTYDPVYQSFLNDRSLLISPNRLTTFYDYFKEDYAEFKTGAISFGTLGSDLNSDHNKEESLNREDSKERVEELLETVKNDGCDIMVNQGNSYVIEYATDILNVPLDSSNRYVASESIPFVGMVLHGYKNFAGTAINLAGDYNNSILKTIENGASLYFLLSYQESNISILKTNEEYNKYYSIRYNIWYEDMVETYKFVNKVLAPVQNSLITAHDYIAERVAEVKYDNGVVFTIDYNDSTLVVNNGETEYTVDLENNLVTSNEGTVTLAEFVAE